MANKKNYEVKIKNGEVTVPIGLKTKDNDEPKARKVRN